MQAFAIGEALRFGWGTFKKRPWFIMGAVIIVAIFSSSFSYKASSSEEAGALVWLMIPVGIVWWVLSIAVQILFTRFLLKAHDSVEGMKYMDTLPARPFWKYVGGRIVVGIAVVVGLILLIVPGVIAMLAFMFTPYLVVDKKLWPIEAMKESARITKGHRWHLFLFVLAVVGLNIIGALALFVGLLVTMPVTMLASMHIYRKLEHKANEVVPVSV